MEHDAVAADREARLSEAHPAAARATERDQPDLFARLRRHAHRLGDRGDGGRRSSVGDYEEEVVVCFLISESISRKEESVMCFLISESINHERRV